MSNGNHIYTRNRKYLDINVWITLITVAIFSTALLAYKIIDKVHCSEFEILVKGYSAGKTNTFYLGQEIGFSAAMPGAKSILWDFGDHGKASGANVKHSYRSEGKFMITATINGKCVSSINVNIIQLSQQNNNITTISANPITGPEFTYTNEPVNFISTSIAGTYEWTVLNSPDFPVQTANTASYSFSTPGTRTIELKLDNDPAKIFRKDIQILPAVKSEEDQIVTPDPLLPPIPSEERNEKKDEEEKTPEKPKILGIANEELKNMLNQVTDGKKDAQSFNQYLCNGAQTRVLANESEQVTFGTFIQKIYDKKKIDIKFVEAVRDENNCVTIIKIKYKKRGLFN